LNDNQRPDVAAQAWLKANPQVLDAWLNNVVSRDGQPALAVVKAQLAQ
ncbi:MAG: glycine betaine/proline transport system substrate-binding protein, partial [Rhodoferax sp.]